MFYKIACLLVVRRCLYISLFFCAAFFLFTSHAQAQQTDTAFFNRQLKSILDLDSTQSLTIDSIQVSGNKKTKRYIVAREILLKQYSVVRADSLLHNIELSRQLVYNTNLFSDVSIVPRFTQEGHVALDVTVKERWYIYPTPQFQLVDRNFNEWINRYNASLERVVYGV